MAPTPNNTILLVEDEEHDVFFLRRALQKAGFTNHLEVVSNGEDAIRYLSGTHKFSDRTQFPLPQFIFLDLKMPVMGGFDVLAWLQQHPTFQIPVAVLSSSPEEQDIKRAHELGAACYLIKPPTPEMLQGCWTRFALR
jgi:CheY-like chemotaxis protein